MIEKIQKFIKEKGLNIYDIAVMTESGLQWAYCQPCNPCNDSNKITDIPQFTNPPNLLFLVHMYNSIWQSLPLFTFHISLFYDILYVQAVTSSQVHRKEHTFK